MKNCISLFKQDNMYQILIKPWLAKTDNIKNDLLFLNYKILIRKLLNYFKI